jgi:DNA-binding PadR family transcriptional regulator
MGSVTMQQEVVLALLSKQPSHDYDLHGQLRRALGPLSGSISAAQIYVTLSRLEKAGLVVSESVGDAREGRDRRIYDVTSAGRLRVAGWLDEVVWPRPDLAEFHLKLVAAAAAHLADPVDIVDRQRRELLRQLRDAQRAALAEPDGSPAALLLEGVVLRQQADLTWLESCERSWSVGS